MENSKSLTVVPVLFQSFGPELPVFAQSTDAIHFSSLSDSLELVYPESKYVKALRAEAKKRQNYLDIETQLNNAEVIGYPDIELPDVNANKIKLSQVDAKVVIVFFWSAADAAQKMFNLDFLKGVYEDYHKKGLEIYQVALDGNEHFWKTAVENIPWVCVRDEEAPYCQAATLYGVRELPTYFLVNRAGELVMRDSAVKDLEAEIQRLLKE
jgi:peroxiredoxin